jgi:hypothetical protein
MCVNWLLSRHNRDTYRPGNYQKRQNGGDDKISTFAPTPFDARPSGHHEQSEGNLECGNRPDRDWKWVHLFSSAFNSG